MKASSIVTAIALSFAASGVPAQSPGPSDAQIAAIVVTANQVDIDAGKLAHSASSNEEVKDFAQRMITDHTGVNEAATALVAKLNVEPQASATSNNLKDAGQKSLERLKALKGAQFDKTYLDNEVTYHQTVLDAIDKTLIPGAKNEELKALLINVRPAFVGHLEHAKQLRAALGK